MWIVALKLLKNPLVIVSVVSALLIGTLYIKIQFLEGKITRVEANLVLMTANFNACKVNEGSLLGALQDQKDSIENMETATKALQDQLRNEQQVSSKWEERYKNRPVITQIKEVPVIQYIDKGLVLDEDSSKEYINYFNSLFD